MFLAAFNDHDADQMLKEKAATLTCHFSFNLWESYVDCLKSHGVLLCQTCEVRLFHNFLP